MTSLRKNILHATIIILTATLLISGLNIFQWLHENQALNKQIKQLEDLGKVRDVKDDNPRQTSTKANQSPENQDLYDYNNISLINASLAELKAINSDTVGWIRVNGTNINYPFVQTTDNDYYLHHAFDKTPNGAGWIFRDYRNSDETAQHQIIYGHARQNGVMFGSLKNVLSEDWYNNSANHFIKTSTENHNSLWQIFSVYKITTTSDYLKVDFENEAAFANFIQALKKRSLYNFPTTLTAKEQILTLSTCHSDNERTVVHAKLVKQVAK